jgi:hypothetical protein
MQGRPVATEEKIVAPVAAWKVGEMTLAGGGGVAGTPLEKRHEKREMPVIAQQAVRCLQWQRMLRHGWQHPWLPRKCLRCPWSR